MTPKYAIVRNVSNTYDRCVRVTRPVKKIDVAFARQQHQAYCRALESLGLKLIKIEADDRFPDCCFAEDPAIVIGDTAIITRMGVSPRTGEELAIEKALKPYKKIRRIKPPGTLEGGDVLQIGLRIYIGLSSRTNLSGIRQVRAIVSKSGYQVIPVRIKSVIHLKTACSYLGSNYLILAGGCFDHSFFGDYRKIIVPKPESYSANCISVGSSVMAPKGCPRSKKLIQAAGFKVKELDMSEFRKGGGSLTCLSIIF